MAGTLGADNPFRYRGYYYDDETELYYLNSRYYNPEWGRFINADALIRTHSGSVFSTNMYAYCENNPVNHSDSTGQWFGLDDLIAGAVGAVVGLASQLFSDVVTSVCSGSWQFSSWQTYVGAGVGGAVGGITAIYAGPVVGAAVSNGVSTLVGQILENVTSEKKRSAGEIAANTVVDATIGAVFSKVVPVKVSGTTIGRNCMDAVYKSGLTKLGNKTVSKMSTKVIAKGIMSGFISDLGISTAMGFKGLFEQYGVEKNYSPTEAVYWCTP